MLKAASTSTANPPLVASLAQQALGEIEALLCFRQLLLQFIDTMLDCLEPLRDVDRWRLRTSGAQTNDLEHRESGNANEYQERGKKYSWFHVAFLS
jgi:hypothetical protein